MKLIRLNPRCLWLYLSWMGLAALNPQPAQAGGIVTNASFSALALAMEGGGLVQIQTDGTFTFEYPLVVSQDTILNASGRKVTLSGNSAQRLFAVAKGTQFSLNQLTLTSGSNAMGAAILNLDGTVIATNCIFSRNTAAGTPGSSGSDGADTVGAGEDGRSGEDGTEGRGGAIYNQGVLRLLRCDFLSNQAVGGAGGAGGNGGNGSWRGGNGGHGGHGAASFGGAIFNSGELWLSNCTFSANTSRGGLGGEGGTNGTGTAVRYPGGGGSGGQAAGGAIFNLGQLVAINSTFATNAAAAGNAASKGGFINNGAAAEPGPGGGTAYGGAVENLGDAVFLQNTFYTNTVRGGDAGDGGAGAMGGAIGGNGGHAYGGSLDNAGTISITNCTLATGFATGGQPGQTTRTQLIFNDTGEPGEARGANIALRSGFGRLKNSILTTASPSGNAYGSWYDAGNNISSDKTCRFSASTSRNSTDPRLGALANNGGATATMALQRGSPAIDKAAEVLGLVADQRGQSRPSGPASDIGAYEAASYIIQGQATTGASAITNLEITLVYSNLTRVTYTDAEGSYSFDRVAPGLYKIFPPTNGIGFAPSSYVLRLGILGTNEIDKDFVANPSRITNLQILNHQCLLSAIGFPTLPYQALTSPDLVHWQTLGTNTANASGLLEFIDPNPPSESQRFYQLQSP
jgi:hypothetical protein